MREIILDTETTGLDPASGHRIVEIGCVEVYSRLRTGKSFHCYLNPQRDMPEEAQRIHGLSGEFLKDKPIFAEKVDEFLTFLGGDPLVIHNAGFDMRFINHELQQHGFPAIPMERAIDTLLMARRKFPGAPATLDALCKRFEIDLSSRTKHGALLDAELLADVYLELTGGRQVLLALEEEKPSGGIDVIATIDIKRERLEPRVFLLSPEELEAHAQLLAKLKAPVWAEFVQD